MLSRQGACLLPGPFRPLCCVIPQCYIFAARVSKSGNIRKVVGYYTNYRCVIAPILDQELRLGSARGSFHTVWVESRCGAVAVGWAYLFPPLSSGGASLAQPWLRFHIPLIEPDVQISRIRLSDKASRLRPRLAAPARGQAYQAKMAVQVREWIAPAPSSPDLVLETQPPAQPHRGVVVESAIRP
jgi:hypothetical protein